MNNPSEYTKLIDINAERSVLGACMIDPGAMTQVAALLDSGDFYRETNGYIYAAMQKLADRQIPIDPITLADELTKAGKIDVVGGVSEIQSLAFEVPSAIYAQHYARIIADKATLRRLTTAAGKIAETVFTDDIDATKAIDEAERILFAVTTGKRTRTMEHISAPLQRVISGLDQVGDDLALGIPTGFSMMDRILGGLQRSDLIILAARPGMGKSSLALSIADNAAHKLNAHTAIFSLEMSKEQFIQRLLSMRTGVDSHRLRLRQIHDDEWPIVLEVANEIDRQPIYIEDTAGMSVDAVRREARRLHAEHGIDLIVIDYLQLMTGEGQNREQEIAYISRNLKAMAKELNVPVLALSQLSRGVEARADKRPMLSDLRESGSQEQDADAVLFIYRDDYYNENSDKQNIADVIIAKHRHGATGTVSLYFRKELTLFRDLEIERTELN